MRAEADVREEKARADKKGGSEGEADTQGKNEHEGEADMHWKRGAKAKPTPAKERDGP